MRKPLNILSIDWDYFVDVTQEQMVNILNHMNGLHMANEDDTNFEWASMYSKDSDLLNIGLTKDFKYILSFISLLNNTLNRKCKSFVADNHQQIVEFLSDSLENNPIQLVHLNSSINNSWISRLDKILNKKAVSSYSKILCIQKFLTKENFDNNIKTICCIDDFLDNFLNFFFKGEVPDLIIINRNGYKTPPHLDNEFGILIKEIVEISDCCFAVDIYDRYSDEFLKLVDELKNYNEEY